MFDDEERGERMLWVGNTASTASETSRQGTATSGQLVESEDDALTIASSVLGYTGAIAGVAVGVGSATSTIAKIAGGSEFVMNGIGTAQSVVGAVQNVAANALNGYNKFMSLVQPGPSVRYSLRTWRTIDGVLDTADWTCHSVELHEALSETPKATLVVELPDPDVDPTTLVGANAELRMEREVRFRNFKGVICRVLHGAVDDSTTRIRIDVVPAFHLMEQRINTRIFQNKTAKEILEIVFDEGLRPYARKFDLSSLSNDGPERDYCVQYRESDFDFCCRLMEEEGISYHYVHDFVPCSDADSCSECGQRHRAQHPCEQRFEVLTLSDSNAHYVRLDEFDLLPVPIVARSASGTEGISDLQRRIEVVPTRVMVNGRWDFKRCLHPFADRGEKDSHGREREHYDHDVELLLSEHRDSHCDANQAERQADIRRKQQILQEAICIGLGYVVRMKPGMMFEVIAHPKPELNGLYLLTRVNHVSSPAPVPGAPSGANYHNTFECVSVEVPVVPKRVHRKPRILGAITAIVCGPNAEESEEEHPEDGDRAPARHHRVHTDGYGRVKLWFPWDRYGRRTDRSTCWVRVQQVWAGDGWGSMFLPHVGMEAVVSFVEGDPDRPIVTGTVYNGNNRTPLDVAERDHRKGTLRTVSGNEIRFDDTEGSEEIYVHSQYDYRGLIEHNRSDHIKVDDTETVDGHQVCTVGKNRTRIVHGEDQTTIGKTRTVRVKGGLHYMDVRGEHRVTAGEKVYIDAGNEMVLRVGDSQLTIDGGSITLQSGDGAAVRLDASVLAHSRAGARLALNENVRLEEQSGQSHLLCRGDTAEMKSASGGTITANRRVTVQVGRSIVKVTEEDVAVSSDAVNLDGAESACMLAGGKISLKGVETEIVGGQGASTLKADSSGVTVLAPLINLN